MTMPSGQQPPDDGRVAVVDDDESVCSAVTSLIGSFGFEAEPFLSGQALLNRGASRFACIVTDIQMPVMSGIQLKEGLDQAGLNIPVIMITSRTEPELRARALATHPLCILDKPFEAEALRACLRQALGT